MKIVAIFAEKLYACQYDNETFNEYARLMNLWTDVVYLRQYASQNYIADKWNFITEVMQDAKFIDDLIEEIIRDRAQLESFFRPLNDVETGVKILSFQKGKRYKLRIYAVKLDKNLFLITGGAIKLVHKMKEHLDTQIEKDKLEQVKIYLKNNFVFDGDSFYELINENYEDE